MVFPADVVASVILTGKIPNIVDAFRIEPHGGTRTGLKTTKLYGQIEIDPVQHDFFKVVIEQRKVYRCEPTLKRMKEIGLTRPSKFWLALRVTEFTPR
jgi:hypothetical protein